MISWADCFVCLNSFNERTVVWGQNVLMALHQQIGYRVNFRRVWTKPSKSCFLRSSQSHSQWGEVGFSKEAHSHHANRRTAKKSRLWALCKRTPGGTLKQRDKATCRNFTRPDGKYQSAKFEKEQLDICEQRSSEFFKPKCWYLCRNGRSDWGLQQWAFDFCCPTVPASCCTKLWLLLISQQLWKKRI